MEYLSLPALVAAIWIALLLVLLVRSAGDDAAMPAASLTRGDVLIAALFALAASSVRIWPLLGAGWVNAKPDEGVYLGGAWLLRDGAVPYRDFVLAHLPGGLLVLQPAAWLIRLWHDNSPALLAARCTAALSDGAAAGLVYLAVRLLVRRPGALLAGLVYASDALAVEYSRAVMLDPLQAPWLMLGALLLLATMRGRRLAFGAGLALGVGVTVKISGVAVMAAAVLALLLGRRWRDLAQLLAGAALAVAVICGAFVAAGGDEIVRQTLLLQLQRGRDAAAQRLHFLLGDPRMLFTAAAMLLGSAALAAEAWRRPLGAPWRFVVLWCLCVLAVLLGGASYYEHYATQLLAPAALLAAAFGEWLARLPWRRAALAAAAALLLPLWLAQAALLPRVDRRPLGQAEAALLRSLPSGRPVLSWVALNNILAGRPISSAPGGPYFLDTFLGDSYLDSPLNRRWPDAEQAYARAARAADYILGTRAETGDLPGLRSEFIWQPVTEQNSTVLFTRVDQPETRVVVGADLELLGRAAARVETQAAQRWIVQPIHWRAPGTPSEQLALALHLLDASGQRVAQLDVPLNGAIAWEPGVITTLEYRLEVPPQLAAGTYQLRAVVYSWQDAQALPMTADGGEPLDDGLELGRVEVPDG